MVDAGAAGHLRVDQGRDGSRHQADPRDLWQGIDADQHSSHFFDGSADNAAYKALDEGMKEQGATVDLFTNDGFVAAQMIVHAIEASDSDVDAMVSALEGWKFEGPKGPLEIRAEDHAVLQPMFTATLKEEGTNVTPVPRDPAARSPPVTPFK